MAERIEFFRVLARDFGPDQQRLRAAWSDYDRAPTSKNVQLLLRIVEPPRQELFRRLDLAPGGTAPLCWQTLVRRADELAAPALAPNSLLVPVSMLLLDR
jgi:hypothetical protein